MDGTSGASLRQTKPECRRCNMSRSNGHAHRYTFAHADSHANCHTPVPSRGEPTTCAGMEPGQVRLSPLAGGRQLEQLAAVPVRLHVLAK